MALQLRRGTNAQRLAMTPVIGELIYVTDYELVTTSVTSINTTTDTLTTTAAHGLSVNQQVKYIGATLNGLTVDQVYFVKTAPTITDFTLSTSLGGGTLDITGSFTVDLVFAKTPTNAAGAPLGTNSTPLWVGDGVTVGGIVAASLNLDDLLDVDITSLAEGNTFYYDATTGFWRNTNIINVNDATNNVTLLGDLAVNGGDITTTVGAGGIANLYNSSAIGTINIGNSVVTEVNIGNVGSGRVFAKTPSFETASNATVGGDLAVNGGDITTTFGTGNLFNTTATTVNIGNGANTELNLGSPTGGSKVVIKPETIVGLSTTQNVFDTVATTVNAFGAATSLDMGAATGTTTINNNAVVTGDLAVNGSGGFIADITTTQTSASVFNTTATTVNIGGAATTMSIGNASGTVTIPGNLTVSGTTTTLDTQTLLVEDKNITIGNVAIPSDVTAAGGGITLLGATNKTITWNNATDGWEFNQPLKVTGNIVTSGDLAVNGGDITTTSANATLFNTNATSIDIGNGATTAVRIGASSGVVNIKAPSLVQNPDGGASTTFDLFNTITTDLNIGGAATTVDIGSTASGTTTIGYDLVVNKDLAVNGGDITTTQAIASLFNTTATTVNIGDGATTQVNIGNNASGTVNIKSQSLLQNDLGGVPTTFNLFNTITTDLNIGGAATTVDIGANSGTMTIGNPTVVGTQTTQNLFNTVATTLNIGGASQGTNIGSTVGGTTTIGRDLSVLNDLFVADSITVGNQAQIQTSTLTTTSTATVALNTTTRNVMTGLINIIQGSDVHCLNFTAVKTGASTAMLTTYAEMYDNISLASFTADVSGSFLRLLVTPASATSTVFSVVRTSLT